jgi:long-subunit fatty acid transport protein
VSADLTWYRWSAYPGPALHISPLDPDDTVAAGLNYPPEEDPDFSDIFVPRLGGEFFLGRQLALRGGLAYRASPAPTPRPDQRGNLLDSDLLSLSLGGGYQWKGRGNDSTRSASSTSIDFHARVQHMQEGSVDRVLADGSAQSYRFGGQIYDAGMTLTMGW